MTGTARWPLPKWNSSYWGHFAGLTMAWKGPQRRRLCERECVRQPENIGANHYSRAAFDWPHGDMGSHGQELSSGVSDAVI